MSYQPAVSVIMPLHNAENTMRESIESLLHQTIDSSEMEIVLVNDGSTDGTASICEEYGSQNSNVVVLHQENSGVSAARNAGMDIAKGKYLAFLDGDDTLAPTTLEAATLFFDKNRSEIDIVVCPLIITKNDTQTKHVSSKVLKRTGVYDVSLLKNAYALVTMMSILIKNDGEHRFDEALFVHEDELFIMQIVLQKEKLGYINEGAYYYKYRADSAARTKMHPYYQFEPNIRMWENLFNAYPSNVPKYLQASYFNELAWKLREDALFPYHYPKEEFEQARDRILQLLNRIDLDVIMKADNTDIYHKIFFLRTRKPSQLSFSVSSTGLSVSCNNVVLHYQKKIEAYILKTGAHGKEWRMTGFLKSPVFSICEEKPRLFLGKMRSYGEERLECPLFESSWSLHRSKTKTNIFWGFDIRIPLFEESVFCLEVELSGATLPVAYCFSDKAIFSGKLKRWSYAVNNCVISVDASGYMSIDPNNPRKAKESRTESDLIAKRHNAKAYLIRRAMALLPARTKSLWLYYDRGAVGKDNAFFQFMHDIETNDGIERYYVTSLDAGKWTEVFGSRYKKHIVSFDSNKHKILHLQADLLLVAYIEEENWLPFNKRSYPYFADLIRYGIIHLQHGVLHAHQPWKHSFDRLLIDGEVVSTNYELTNFQQNYLFPREALIDSGMPRYDFIDSDAEPKRRILFAPSWRKYLVHQTQKLDFEPIDNVFLDSAWWKEVSTFLNSETLAEMLDAYDYHLDIKLHPIFKVYSRFFEFDNPRIHLINSAIDSDYEVFITDYSSWVYDFVYLKRKILYFLPDEGFFSSGLNGYREVDIPLQDGFGPFCTSGEQLCMELANVLEGVRPSTQYREADGFFLHYDFKQRERLYRSIRQRIEDGTL